MSRQLTVKHKVSLGFASLTALTAVVAGFAVLEIRSVAHNDAEIIDVGQRHLVDSARLATAIEQRVAAVRGYALSGEARFLERVRAADNDFGTIQARVGGDISTAEEKEGFGELGRAEREFEAVEEQITDQRRSGVTESSARDLDARLETRSGEFASAVAAFVATEEKTVAAQRQEGAARASFAVSLLIVLALIGCALAVGLALTLGASIARQIGGAIQSVQSSSAELQAAANQQAAGSKEQSAATSEVTTTLKELVATSRQMAESSQRVTRIAESTGGAAQSGDVTVQKAQGSIAAIKRQVDLIVTHMLDLGKKSQQVGGILEIINELAEQTNILAINASIESAGAGEAGKRFAVVADEIRRLADRVGGSTREIRGLIDEIRGAANTTVMVTEDGLKAVDAGSRQFGEVAASFRQITGMVETTTEAAREIELGTKQQVTAIEQVNAALADIAQAARETEASTRQTLATSGELATLSRRLTELVRRSVAAAQPGV